MKIQQLEIKNFRGIREMQIDFHPRLNVFAGKNGVGKTTILDALGKNLAVARLNHVNGRERRDLESSAIIPPVDIQLGAKQSDINLQFLFKNKFISTSSSSNPEIIASDLFEYFPEANTDLPYRIFVEDRNVIDATRLPKKNQWGELISTDSTNFYSYYFNWISEREALENNQIRRFIDSGNIFGKDHFKRDQVLQLVKTAVENITGFSGLFHDRELYDFILRKKSGTKENILLFHHLSSGEKHLISFVVALAVFLTCSFPQAENPLHEEAVFLIDAIELHLHPSWQRELISKLLSSFPNCQFIITTHSPQVLGNVKPESIFLLKRENDDIICEQPDESYGMTMDRVLELVMDETARPSKEVQKHIEDLFDHISREEFDKAANLIKTLKKDIPTDPDLIRAEILLHKKGLSL